jgi:hypothetical protein
MGRDHKPISISPTVARRLQDLESQKKKNTPSVISQDGTLADQQKQKIIQELTDIVLNKSGHMELMRMRKWQYSNSSRKNDYLINSVVRSDR